MYMKPTDTLQRNDISWFWRLQPKHGVYKFKPSGLLNMDCLKEEGLHAGRRREGSLEGALIAGSKSITLAQWRQGESGSIN